MTIVAHKSDNTISEKAEASFEESDPQRLKNGAVFPDIFLIYQPLRHFTEALAVSTVCISRLPNSTPRFGEGIAIGRNSKRIL